MLSSYIILRQNEANLEQAINSASVVRLGKIRQLLFKILLILNIMSLPIYLQTDSYHKKGGKKRCVCVWGRPQHIYNIFLKLSIFLEKRNHTKKSSIQEL